MQKRQKRQCDDVQWEHEPECLGPKRNRVLGGGKRASERVNRRCDERLLEAVRLDVVTPGLAASEERHEAGRLRHDDLAAGGITDMAREKTACSAGIEDFDLTSLYGVHRSPQRERVPGIRNLWAKRNCPSTWLDSTR